MLLVIVDATNTGKTEDRGKHRSAASLYRRGTSRVVHGHRYSMAVITKATSLLPDVLLASRKRSNRYCFMVRSTEINAAHTHNHEAKDLSSGRRSEFLLATYSKYCLLEVSRVPDIRSLVFLEALSQLWRATFGLMQIRGIHRHIRQQKAPTDRRERDTEGIFFFFKTAYHLWKNARSNATNLKATQ